MFSLSNAFKAANISSRIVLSSLRPAVLQIQPSAGVKSIEEKVGLPPKPKKPLTPFFRFMRDMRPVVLAENPQLKVTDVVKLISKKWETAEPSIKEKFQEQYIKEKVAYVESRAKYDSKITEEQRSEMKQIKREAIAVKERRRTKKRIAELDRPKKPPSAFLMFIARERTETPQRPNETYRQWHANATAKWTSLSDSQKDEYLQMFRKQIVKYREEITQWEEKMIRMGNIDVVRPEILIDSPTKINLKSPK